jgi:dTDP-4-amino-4,6-dideoxygalactose transaminase
MIPFFDLHRVLQKHESKLTSAFKECLDSAKFINGPQVGSLEDRLAVYLRASNVIGVSSGTDALLAIFMALDLNQVECNIYGAKILVTPFTFAASATSIMRAGSRPVFVDLAKDSFYPSIDQYSAALTSKTKGILAVHLFGEPANLTELKEFCKTKNLFLIEDCAQAMGTKWNGHHVGSVGDAAAYSFFPAKNLGCFGDGGAVTTNNDELAEKIRMIRSHGSKMKYTHEILGGNFRLDTIQAAILSVLLPELDDWIKKRTENADYYSEALENIEELTLPTHVAGHSWNQYTVQTTRRDSLKKWLDSHNIGNAIYYPHPLHQQKVFKTQQSLPEAEKRCKNVLSLPIYPGLQREEQDFIISKIEDFFKRNR